MDKGATPPVGRQRVGFRDGLHGIKRYTQAVKSTDEALGDATRCPRCHAPNACAIAAGAQRCWCFDVRPGVTTTTGTGATAGIAATAAQPTGQACLCRQCLAGTPGN